eukprot:TRINITY_DN27165_c0_g1_i1.p1 TRINITY_DN27165_c0_g1~~TRINITY_DN27165_c0_g1_i1.p1  ORF type:complete len:400 (-),score=75.17 TRINITY_DN27165_c0_g1_i1:127-1257(-)
MFRDATRQCAPGLKLPTVPHLGAFNGGDYKLAPVLSGVEFLKEPHQHVPDKAFEMLMRRDVDEVEAMVVTYDAQSVRDHLLGSSQPAYRLNVLWQPYLFPELKYREESSCEVECCVLEMHGASVCKDLPQGLAASLRKHSQTVLVKDRIYMMLGPDVCTLALNPLLPICWFWTCMLPPEGHREKGSRCALVTKHIVLNETISSATADLRLAMAALTPVSPETILTHLRDLLLAVQKATGQISKVMARCESAYEGVPLDRISKGGKLLAGTSEPDEIWEEQLQLLSRNVAEPSTHGAPVLAEMARLRVYQVLGRLLASASGAISDDQALKEGTRLWAEGASGADKAKAIHKAFIGFVSDFEHLSERQGEMLSTGGPL